MDTAIWWVRRDLRLSDNQALMLALAQAERVIPLFILDPKLLNSQFTGQKRVAFLFQGLDALDKDLRRCACNSTQYGLSQPRGQH